MFAFTLTLLLPCVHGRIKILFYLWTPSICQKRSTKSTCIAFNARDFYHTFSVAFTDVAVIIGSCICSYIATFSMKKNYQSLLLKFFLIAVNYKVKVNTNIIAISFIVKYTCLVHFSYQWYCHVDDDMYANVPHLSQLLQQYDPHKPYYLGNFPDSVHKYPFQVSSYIKL